MNVMFYFFKYLILFNEIIYLFIYLFDVGLLNDYLLSASFLPKTNLPFVCE